MRFDTAVVAIAIPGRVNTGQTPINRRQRGKRSSNVVVYMKSQGITIRNLFSPRDFQPQLGNPSKRNIIVTIIVGTF